MSREVFVSYFSNWDLKFTSSFSLSHKINFLTIFKSHSTKFLFQNILGPTQPLILVTYKWSHSVVYWNKYHIVPQMNVNWLNINRSCEGELCNISLFCWTLLSWHPLTGLTSLKLETFAYTIDTLEPLN